MADGREGTPSQLRKGVVELAILALLHRDEAYGGEIVDRLAGFPGLAITAGTAYPLLARLKRAGLIASVWRESPLGPPRKYYRLTAEGEASYADLATAWTEMRNDMEQLLGTDVAP